MTWSPGHTDALLIANAIVAVILEWRTLANAVPGDHITPRLRRLLRQSWAWPYFLGGLFAHFALYALFEAVRPPWPYVVALAAWFFSVWVVFVFGAGFRRSGGYTSPAIVGVLSLAGMVCGGFLWG